MYFFTSDEHYGHGNIIKYSNRPFNSVAEMDHEMVTRHNSIIQDDDVVYHLGDFTLNKTPYAMDIIRRLKGHNVFITGSHDKWMKNADPFYHGPYLIEQMINGTYVVACHYAMRVWPRSHYGSIQVYGHSHGNLPPLKNQLDVGVDSWNYYPVSLDQVILTITLNQGKTNDQASPSA